MTTNTLAAVSANAVAALSSLKAGIAKVQQQVHIAGGTSILRMGRDGIWIYGQDNTEVQDGSHWASNPFSLKHGYICWKKIPEGSKEKPKLYGEAVVPLHMDKPDLTKLQAHDDEGNPVDHTKHPWQDVITIDLKCMNGEDAGTQVVYKPSSTGGLRAMDGLLDEINGRPDGDLNVVPVLELLSDSYDNKTWGKTYIPILKIVKWIGMDGVAVAAPEQVEEQTAAEEPAPAAAEPAQTSRRRRAATAAPAAEEPAPAAPQAADVGVRRRRRAA